MPDRLKTIAAWSIAGLAGVVVAAAIAMTGGPVEARKEHRDRQRLADFRAISAHLSCMVGDDTGPLPETPAPAPGCRDTPRLSDPFTGQPYGYHVVDDQTIRLCAGFEARNPPDRSGLGLGPVNEGSDAGQGCREYRIYRAGAA